MSEADAQLEQLKTHFGVDKDVELARKLMVDKRTVSAWRTRGSVPARYRSIAEGGDPQSVMTPPMRWDEHERAAFDLAMFRLARALQSEAASGEFQCAMQAFGGAWGYFWEIMFQARHDLIEQMNSGVEGVRSAFALLVHADLENDDGAVAATRKMIADLGKVSKN